MHLKDQLSVYYHNSFVFCKTYISVKYDVKLSQK